MWSQQYKGALIFYYVSVRRCDCWVVHRNDWFIGRFFKNIKAAMKAIDELNELTEK
jgi:hypothetical protein